MRNSCYVHFGVLCAVIAMSGVSRVEASVLNTLVANEINFAEDIDYEFHVDAGSDGLVGVNDLLVAMLEVDSLAITTGIDTLLNGSTTQTPEFDYTATTRTFTAISLLKVAIVDNGVGNPGQNPVDGIVARYFFTAPTAQEWVDNTGLADMDTGSVLAFFDDPAGNPHIDPSDTGGLQGSLDTASEGPRLWEMGLGDAGTFWTAQTIGSDPTDILQITSLTFLASLNVTDWNGLDGTLVKHTTMSDPDLGGAVAGLFATPTHIELQGGLGAQGGGSNFNIGTDTDFYLAPIPEPTSMLVWAGLLGVVGLVGLRRRRRA